MSRLEQAGNAIVAVLIWFVLIIGGGVGWILNLVHIVNSDFSHVTGLLVLRVIGVFLAPIGAVLGYFS